MRIIIEITIQMMRIKKLNIQEPCHQSWQQMTDVQGGRHCESCSKTVVDFTKMGNDEIINYLSVSRNVCGRIHEQQMESVNMQLVARQPQNKGSWAKWVMAAALFLGTAYNHAIAQSATSPTEQADIVKRPGAGLPQGKIAVSDSTQYQTLTGIILGSDDNLPLPGVSVTCDKGKIGTLTDVNGMFSIRVPVSAKILNIRFVGYEAQVIKLKKINKIGTLKLKINATMLGGMGVTKSFSIRESYAALMQRIVRRDLKG